MRVFREQGRKDPLVGATRSDSVGHWVVDLRKVSPARYYAKVLPKQIGSGSHDHTCGPYRSSTLHFG